LCFKQVVKYSQGGVFVILNSKFSKKEVLSFCIAALLGLVWAAPLCAQEAISASQKKLNVLYERYNTALAKKNYTQAKAALDGIIALRPSDVNARKQRCIVSWESADWVTIRQDYDAILRYDSNDVHTLLERGLLRWYEGKCEQACTDVVRARALDSSHFHFAPIVNVVCTSSSRATMSLLEQSVLDEINTLRMNPRAYIPTVEAEFASNASILASKEGASLMAELVRALETTPAMQALRGAVPLIVAAKDHADDLHQHGKFGHRGSDSSMPHERVGRYALHRKVTGENIGYGPAIARTLVVGLLLDDGIAGRGHRVNLLRAEYKSCGIGIAPHVQYPCVCVQVFEEAVYPANGAR